MAWNSLAPDGTISVKANKTVLRDNTIYVETNMNKDHFWNIGSNEDGHHRYVQMPKFTTPQLSTTPANPTLSASMDGVYYCKQKTLAESDAQQDVQPFYENFASNIPSTQIMQLLGIRCMCVFNAPGGVVTVKYSHNLTSVVRTSLGEFTATFPQLPSENYLFLGGVVGPVVSGGANSIVFIPATNTLSTSKTNTFIKFNVASSSTVSGVSRFDPTQCWFVIFGG